jgi:hypothetical protein
MIDKKQAIINGIMTDIKRLEQDIEEDKENLKQRIDQGIDVRFGLSKYAEQLTAKQSKIEAYYNALRIIQFVFDHKEEE